MTRLMPAAILATALTVTGTLDASTAGLSEREPSGRETTTAFRTSPAGATAVVNGLRGGRDSASASRSLSSARTIEGIGVDGWHARAVRNRRQINHMRRSLRTLATARPYGNHWLDNAFLCLHANEGSWSSRTGNGYYGGLQMDNSFMHAYGSDFLRWLGTADHWPISVQIAVGVRAYYSGRGFGPWPNTRRMCGL